MNTRNTNISACAECPVSLLCLTDGDTCVGAGYKTGCHNNFHLFFHWCPMCTKNYIQIYKVDVPGHSYITVPPGCPALSVGIDAMDRTGMLRVCEDCFVLYREEEKVGHGWER